jgi:GAF domain-containing protein
MTRRAKAGGKGTKQADRKSGQPKRRGRPQNAPSPASPAGRKTPDIEQLIHERDEALEQQEASLQVLQLISSSPGDLQPVFVAILRNATRICAAKFGVLWLCEGKGFRCVALHDVPKAFETDFQRQPVIYPHPGSPLDVLAATQQVAHISDLAATAAYTQRAPSIVPAVELGGVRTLVHVPMVKRGSGLVGAITVFRQEVRPFADKEIALLQNFAAQAVIAIENARLLNELRQRTTDLTESLEQQTATSDVLRVISSAPGDLESVFAAMLDNAVRICDAAFGNIHSWDGHGFNVLAMHNVPPSYAEARQRSPAVPPHPKSLFGALTATRSVVHFADAAANEGYAAGVPSVVAAVELGGGRTMLGVPMLKEGELVGAFTLARREVRPFTDKQIALVTNFAAQAVIAIENARLLNELRQRTDDLSQRTTDLTEALEQQTATSEVLKVISGSPADLQPVFNAMLANATRLCEASFGTLWLCENNDQMRMAALHGRLPGAFQGKWSVGTTHRPSPSVPTARAFKTRKPVQITDLKQDRAYIERDPLAVASVDAGGIRSLIAVPLLKDGTTAIGAITIYRQEVRPFTEKQIDLVANFAAQAVIAIENARLLNELRESLEQQTATSEVLKVVSSSPGDLQPVFTAMLENAVRICDANFGNLLLYENDAYRMVAMHNAPEAYANLRTSASVIRAAPEDALGRIAATKKLMQITDLLANDSYKKGTPLAVSGATLAGIRTFFGVPMLKDDRLVGALVIYRKEVRPFNEKQIALVQNFADQAVIAIENARLLSELRQRTKDLTQRTSDLTER